MDTFLTTRDGKVHPYRIRYSGEFELRLVRGLRVQPSQAALVHEREQAEARVGSVAGVAVAHAEPIIESSEVAASGDVVEVGVKFGDVTERLVPVAIDARADDPVVLDLMAHFVLLHHVVAPFHQAEVLQQTLQPVRGAPRRDSLGRHVRLRDLLRYEDPRRAEVASRQEG